MSYSGTPVHAGVEEGTPQVGLLGLLEEDHEIQGTDHTTGKRKRGVAGGKDHLR